MRGTSDVMEIFTLMASPFAAGALAVVIRLVPESRAVALPSPACEDGGDMLRDWAPIAGQLPLPAKRRNPTASVSFYLAVQLAAFGVAAWSAAAVSDPVRLCATCVLGWTLLALAWIDVEHMLLPDALTLPLVLFGLATTWRLDPDSLTQHALGTVAGYGAFAGIAMLYRKLRGHDGLGLGDAKLLAAAGAWLGWAALPMLVVSAAFAALATTLFARIGGRTMHRNLALPFGPFLAAALWLMWLYGAA